MKIVIIIVIILVLIIIYNQQEHFDVYRNHDFGALDVYKNSNIQLNSKPISNYYDANLLAKYDWSTKDVLGYTVYDRMYDNLTHKKIWGDDYEYGYRDINTTDLNNVYDSKFSLLNESNQMANYKITDMADPNLVQAKFNGEVITLAQKQY